jgi:hypothetical protein
MSPSEDSWVAMEGSYGNGFLDRLEHRKQFKFNGGRVVHAGGHTLTLLRNWLSGLRLCGGAAADLRIQCGGCGGGMDGVSRYDRSAAEGPDAHRARGAERRVEARRKSGGAALGILPHLQSVAVFGLRAGTDPAERVPHGGRRERRIRKQDLEGNLRCWPERTTSAKRRGATIWTTTTFSIPLRPTLTGRS